jgi:thiamine-monophosphate kinase
LPLREKSLIGRIRRLTRPGRGVITGIGDDCAVLRIGPGQELLVTTDFSLEGVHFRREWHRPEVIGHRCLARGLSDIAAMGGRPVAAFLSLALPKDLPQVWADGFLRGLLELAGKFHVPLAGGDTAQSPTGVLADIVVVGCAPRGKAIRRSGARAGDRIFVTGQLGGPAAALNLLFTGRKPRPEHFPRHFHPVPRIAIGQRLLERGLAASMIDLSDGLSTDLAHLCAESGVGAEIRPEAIPRASVGKPPRTVDLELALHGGEDYELLFTARPGKRIPPRIAGVAITQIGEVKRGNRVFLRDANGKRSELLPQGWEHFA